uniref:Transmembrane protein n=1 Tax=Alexandrium andersonii TaxID=327968 RepID=A0A7S2D4U4_9DINO
MAAVVVTCSYLAFLDRRHGTAHAIQWTTGYLLEAINAIENTFVFHSILRSVRTPPAHARKVLSIVMICEMLFQTVCYLGLAATLRRLHFLPYLVGIWLIYTGCSVVSLPEDSADYDILDNWLANCWRRCFGKRFHPAYAEQGDVFVVKDNQTTITMLGLVVCLASVLAVTLEVDVVLTKIEELPDRYLSLTSSVFATFLVPEFFYIFGVIFRLVPVLRYGVGTVTIFFGVQMLLGDFVVVPAAINCFVMVVTMLLCVLVAAIAPTADSGAGGAAGQLDATESSHIEDG